jgi:hypothetical protein
LLYPSQAAHSLANKRQAAITRKTTEASAKALCCQLSRRDDEVNIIGGTAAGMRGKPGMAAVSVTFEGQER